MRRLPSTRTLALAATAAAMLFAGCGDSDDSSSASGGGESAKSSKLTIAASGADTYTFMGMLQVAKDKGWFSEEGLEVEIVSGEGGGDTLRVASTGSADMAIAGGTSAVLAASDESQNLEIIGPWFQVNDFVWLTPKKGVKVDGATLGVTSAGSSTELMVKGFQKKMPDAKLKAVTVGGVGDQWSAVKANRITGAFSLSPYSQQTQAEEGAQVLLSGQEVLGDLPADLVVVNKDYAKKNPDALKSFWRVADKAFKYVQDDPAAASQDLAKLIPVDAKYIQESLEKFKAGFDIKVNPEVLNNLSTLMTDTKSIDKPIDWGTMLHQDYLPDDAKADLGA
jgi:NitT/TauT family transport system substrate-binding protein